MDTLADGVRLETLGVLLKFRMSKETAAQVKRRFTELGRAGGEEEVSYLDCVLFDAALAELGEEQAYYGLDDAEWQEVAEARAKAAAGYEIRTIDVSDAWRVVDG